ncbi:MAG: AAA family ATPase, partial [Anaerolineales bacterium]|nr:AAA family ATPase [Anaerolineales bacterium]
MKLEQSGGSRQIGRLARRLAPYIPQRLAQQILRRQLPQVGKCEHLQAATIFCDVSGFSEMANELAADGPRGAEELNRALLMTFTAMIGAVHNAGGFISHFHGDAMLIYIPDDDQRAANRALACAQFLQNLMRASYSELEVNRASEETTSFNLSMKVGVGYGDCLEFVVGVPDESLEFVLAGTAVDEAVLAESQAKSGEVVASQTVLHQAGLSSDTPFRVVTEMLFTPYAQVALYWDAYESDQLYSLANTAANFIPPALLSRLTSDRYAFIAEHRPATSLFVRFEFEGAGFAAPTAGENLQTYYNWARRVVARYGAENGRVNRILTGDKGNILHIIFGAPVAPDAPQQALRCALALQREKPDFVTQQTIGLAAGQVFACTVGSQMRREYTIVGDVVNLSARLLEHCPPGGVVTDAATVQRARQTILFRELPAVSLKGFQKPVPIFQAEGIKQTRILRERFGEKERPLTWRKAEQEQLLADMHQALRGETRVAVLSGSIGAEQRRLVSTAVQQWLQAGGKALIGVGQQHTAEVPFGLWQGVWQSFFNFQPDMPPHSRQQAIRTQIEKVCPACVEDAPLWAEALGTLPSGASARLTGHTADVQKARLLRMMSMCFATAAQQKPLLILLEDAHWADPLSLVLLQDLVHQLPRTPLYFIITFAQTDAFARERLPTGLTLHLQDLDPQDGRDLVQQLLQGHDVPPQLLRYLGLTGSNGRVNPLFLEESVQMLLEDGILRLNGDLELDEVALAQARMPDTVQSLLLSRLDRISAVGRTLLQAASVAGRQFDVGIVKQAIAELRSLDLEPLLAELAEARLISPLSQDNQHTCLFQDDLIQEVAYQSIPYSRRQRWHAHIANTILNQHQANLTPQYPI